MVLEHKNQLELWKILLQYRDTHAAQFDHCIESTINNVLPTARNTNKTLIQQIDEEDFTTIGKQKKLNNSESAISGSSDNEDVYFSS